MRTVLAILVLLVTAAAVEAQVAATRSMRLTWEWQQGAPPDDGAAVEFVLRCGRESGIYTHEVIIAASSAREYRLETAEFGKWYCVVHARGGGGLSAPSNELFLEIVEPRLKPARELTAEQ